jgi:hypothetical protein
MTTSPGRDDDSLLTELGEALAAAGDVTDEMRLAAVAAYTWRSIDDELALAALVFDSDRDQARLVRDGASEAVRHLFFEADGVAVQLELSRDGLLGQLAPPEAGDVVVQTRDGHEQHGAADDLGLFSLSPAPTQPFRLHARVAGTRLVTDWVNP